MKEKGSVNLKVLSPWLYNKYFDGAFILSPSFISVIIAVVLTEFFHFNEVNLVMWIILILLVDVSHVYSSLFRTYFNKVEFSENRVLFTLVPIGVWVIGIILYSMGDMYFWRGLAYIAVFHFIRQQYGFLKLYSMGDQQSQLEQRIDNLMIYNVTLYPIISWHLHYPRNFNWFVQGDFFAILANISIESTLLSLYIVISSVYVIKELRRGLQQKTFNLPKNLIVFGTMISWYVGIVAYNNDLAFTLTNVLTHGVPYIALIWLYGKKQETQNTQMKIFENWNYSQFFKLKGFFLFLLVLFLLGYLEEGLWAGFVWREHLAAFPFFSYLPKITNKELLAFVVPLLAVPQATHYVIDGFIWKLKGPPKYWHQVFQFTSSKIWR